jgi:hypothetical protein
MPDRDHDVSGLSDDQLRRAKRDLEVSLALSFPDSPVRLSIVNEMTAIDTEADRRAGWDCAAERHPPRALVPRSQPSGEGV